MDREIQTQRRDLERSARTVMAQEFACEADAQQALDHWLSHAQPTWHHITGTILSQTRQTRPGRPRKSAPPDDSVMTWHVEIAFGAIDGIRRQRELERLSTFVLITSSARRLTEKNNFLQPRRIRTSGFVCRITCV